MGNIFEKLQQMIDILLLKLHCLREHTVYFADIYKYTLIRQSI